MVDNVKTPCSTTGEQDTNPSVEIKNAAQRLRREIDRYGHNATFVGVGLGVIHVYIEVRRKQYLATPIYKVWETYPVEWHFGVGKIVPATVSPHTALRTPSETSNTDTSPNTNTAADPEPGR